MTELEQRLTNEFGKLAEQYERDQKRSRGRRALGRAGAATGRAIRAGADAVGRAGRSFDGKHAAVGLACNDIDQRIRGTFEECERNDQRLQRCGEGYERTHSLIHGEADQKRKAGNRRDRVEGRIESLIQGRVRSRGWDFSR